MEAHDAIVSWLEQGDHFVRVTAASPLSPSTREVQALHELAAYVNRALPRANWDARHAKQMLKHYLLEFRSTASADVSLGEKERRCRHFSRLKKLHEPKEREVAKRRGGQENRQSSAQTTYVKLVFALTEAQRRERENEVVPENDFSNSCENSEADKDAMKRAGVDEQEKSVEKKKGGETVKKSDQKENGLKKREPKKSKQKPTPGFIELTSGEEEVDEELRRSTRAKRRASRDAVKSAHKDEHGSTSDKKRLESASDTGKSDQVEVSDVTPTQTTQAASSSGSDAARDSPMNYEDAPNRRTCNQAKKSPGKKRRSVAKVTSASQPARSSSKAQRSETPRHKAQNAASPTTPSNQVPRRKSTKSTVPGSLRSAIAVVLSQRQQLLASCRKDPESQDSSSCQTRQRSLSDSDYGLSDIDLPSVDPRPSASSNDTSTSSYGSRSSRHETGPPEGLLPPLSDWSHTSQSNLKRKRVFLSMKRLAFEQLKWYREKDLQQCELGLLHREMEAREILAQQELELKRMRIRADIIQPMIFAGASITDIADRLELL